MNVRSRALRVTVLGIAALALASCSDIHPGSAAVVDGKTISMEKADTASSAYCSLGVAIASQQGVQAVPKADSRRQAVTDLITLEVARKLVMERDLVVGPETFAVTDEQEAQIEQAFPGKDLDEITAAISRSQETFAITAVLGAEATGKKPTDANSEELQAAGQKEIQKAIKGSDVEIDPRFGLDDAAQKAASSGSLSIPESSKEVDAAKLPASQLCS